MRPTLRVLEDAQYDLVLDEALRILAEVGVKVAGQGMRERLFGAGFPVDEATGRILFPPDKVRAAIATVPPSFMLYDRDGEPYAEFGVGVSHFSPGSSGLNILDHRSGQHREASTADFVDYVKVGHQLKNVRLLATAFSSKEIEPLVSDAWRLYLLLKHTTKAYVSGAFSEHAVPRLAQLMELYRRDAADLAARPMAICTVTAAGQFTYNEDSCQNLIDFVEAGIPVEIVPITLMGLNAPVTLLGAAAFHTAEVLAGVTMAQLVKPGAPTHVRWLRGRVPHAEHDLADDRHRGPAPDQHELADRQAPGHAHPGLHRLQRGQGARRAGRLGDGHGGAAGGTVGHRLGLGRGHARLPAHVQPAQARGRRRDRGPGAALPGATCRLEDDIPTTDLIAEMLSEGHVLVADHTMDHWPTALHLPGPVWDRDARDAWAAKGELDIKARATAEVDRLLDAYEATETDPAVDAEARAIIESGLSEGAELPA